MYNIDISRTAKLKKFNSAIVSLTGLKNTVRNEPKLMLHGKAISLFLLTKELKIFKKRILPMREKEIKNQIKKLGNKLKLSSFSLMEYDFHENTHSNILEYIFDYQLIGNEAADFLAAFISGLKENSDDFSSLIKERKYLIEREFTVKNGRMDLFIYNEKNKFAIVIENKIFAEIAEKEILPEEDLTHKTQLDFYINHLNNYYSGYKKLYILLSYKQIQKSEEYKPFVSVDYNYLYNTLESFENIKDSIFNDYKILLYSLINNIYKNKKDIFKQINSLRKNRKIVSTSVNSLEQLRILLNAYK